MIARSVCINRPAIVTVVALLVCSAAPAISRATPGDLDPTFGVQGVALADFGGFDLGRDLVILPDGRIVAAAVAIHADGNDGDFALARFTADGSLDVSFGSGGMSAADFGWDAVEGIALDEVGRIVVVGGTMLAEPYDTRLALTRFLPNGSLDTSFGRGGLVTLPRPPNTASWGYDVAVQPGGSIVTVGLRSASVGVFPVGFGSWEIIVNRFTEGGILDPTFGVGGFAPIVRGLTTPFRDLGGALTLLPDGRMLIGGSMGGEFALIRLTSSGLPDPTWGNGGVVRTNLERDSGVTAMSVRPDGKVVAAGGAAAGCFGCDPKAIALARYSSDGRLDPSFGDVGTVVATVGEGARGLAVLPEGELLVTERRKIRRYTADGDVDVAFGVEGVVARPLDSSLESVAVQPDGRTLVVGEYSQDLSILRLVHE